MRHEAHAGISRPDIRTAGAHKATVLPQRAGDSSLSGREREQTLQTHINNIELKTPRLRQENACVALQAESLTPEEKVIDLKHGTKLSKLEQ